MSDVLTIPDLSELSLVTAIIFVIVAFVVSAIGGAIGGIIVGGKHIGNDLAAMMGSFYGPINAIPAALLALIILLFI